MELLTTLRRKLLAACLAVAAVSLIVVAVALADEVFQPRAWVGPYGEGKHSAEGLVDIIQGEGWQYESCVDIALEGGGYAAKHCNSAGQPLRAVRTSQQRLRPSVERQGWQQ